MNDLIKTMKDPYELGITDEYVLNSTTASIDTEVSKFCKRISVLESFLPVKFSSATYDHISLFCKFQMEGDLEVHEAEETTTSLLIDALLEGKRISKPSLEGGFTILIVDATNRLVPCTYLGKGGISSELVDITTPDWYIVK